MKSRAREAKGNAAFQVEKTKREASALEFAVQPDGAAPADAPLGVTIEIEDSEQPVVAPRLDRSSSLMHLIENVALDPHADVQKLERVMAMFERLKAKEAELAFNAAKGRILKKLAGIKIIKNRSVQCQNKKRKRQNGTYETFKYAPLEEIDKHLRPLLAAENMDLSYSDDPMEDGILVRGRLKHLPSGHYEDSFMPAPHDRTDGKSDVQAVGSTNSFLRRYIACNIFNIVVLGDDDDGAGGTICESQARIILDLIKKAKVGRRFLTYMKAQSVEEAGSLEAAVATISARDYRKAISTLAEQMGRSEASHADPS